jgi:hypothetical protein
LGGLALNSFMLSSMQMAAAQSSQNQTAVDALVGEVVASRNQLFGMQMALASMAQRLKGHNELHRSEAASNEEHPKAEPSMKTPETPKGEAAQRVVKVRNNFVSFADGPTNLYVYIYIYIYI